MNNIWDGKVFSSIKLEPILFSPGGNLSSYVIIVSFINGMEERSSLQGIKLN